MAGIGEDEIIVFERFVPKTIYKTIKLWYLLKSFRFDRVFISPHARYGGWEIPVFAFLIRISNTQTIGSKFDRFKWLYTNPVNVDINLHIIEREFDFFLKDGVLKFENINFDLPSFQIPEESLCYAESILNETSGRIKIGIHPGAGKQLRLWNDIKFAQLADRIIEEYCASIFLIAGGQDDKITREILENMKHPSQVRVIIDV